MTIRDRGLIAVLAVALVLLSGVSLAASLEPSAGQGGPQPSDSVTARPYVEGVLGHATNASPFGERSPADRDLVALLFRGLVRLGPGTSIVPDLASHWEVDSTGKLWTFHLRPNQTWDDGAPITADDVVFTVAVLSDPSYTGPGAASWRDVTATASDELTVTLQLATPLGGFLQAATQPIAPAHLLGGIAPAALPDDPFGQAPVGSGPFRLTYLDSTRAELAPVIPAGEVPTGPGGSGEGGGPPLATPVPTDSLVTPPPTEPPGVALPYLDGIEFRYYDDVASLKAAWDQGLLDAASGLAPTDARDLATDGGRVLQYPGTTLLAVDLDLRPARKDFLDPRVRKALLEAIDRPTIVTSILDGLGTKADSLIPPTSPMLDPSTGQPIAYNPAAAKADLAKAGWTQGVDSWTPKGAKTAISIELLSPEQSANPVAYATAEAVAQNWRDIGLDVSVTPLSAADLLGQRLHPGGFQAALVPLAIGLDPDLYPLLASSQTRTTGSNVSGLQDPSLDRLLSAARAPGTDAARKAAYRALEVRLDAGLYILPIAFRDEYVVLRNTVVGPTPRPVSTSGDRFWDVLTWRLLDGR
ncbi:MAG TPA: ABC transporter substrate-binding protein [Candidatus Limnocylindrales bacterium]|nr:ABC transporter substrate-binding protein [Candidatus Limnocylindrales bacterium]